MMGCRIAGPNCRGDVSGESFRFRDVLSTSVAFSLGTSSETETLQFKGFEIIIDVQGGFVAYLYDVSSSRRQARLNCEAEVIDARLPVE